MSAGARVLSVLRAVGRGTARALAVTFNAVSGASGQQPRDLPDGTDALYRQRKDYRP